MRIHEIVFLQKFKGKLCIYVSMYISIYLFIYIYISIYLILHSFFLAFFYVLFCLFISLGASHWDDRVQVGTASCTLHFVQLNQTDPGG